MSQELAQPINTAVGAPIQHHKGFEEGVDAEDLIIPRIKLLQKTAKEMDMQELAVKPGMLINNITKDIFQQPLEFVPIFKKTYYIRFNPQKDKDYGFDPAFAPGALIYIKSTKEECGQDAEWIDNNPPLAKRTISFMVALPKYPGVPFILTFSKTSLKTGQELVSMLKFAGCDMFARKFTLSSQSAEKNGNTYYTLKVVPAGKVDNVAEYEAMHASMSARVTVEHVAETDAPEFTE